MRAELEPSPSSALKELTKMLSVNNNVLQHQYINPLYGDPLLRGLPPMPSQLTMDMNTLKNLVTLNQSVALPNLTTQFLQPQLSYQQLIGASQGLPMTTQTPFLTNQPQDPTNSSLANLLANGISLDTLQSIPITPMPNPSILANELSNLMQISPPQIINSHINGGDPHMFTISQTITISNDLIGCIIGRNGCTINAIRKLSTPQIKIANLENGAKDRKITITGQADGVSKSIALIQHM
ncbi:Poly(rC)-binding protein 4 [Cichlidogyrus casuarinus]|uniref:Poly(RC)-binding protein 4 n=1 Tax=Cichlidogyrus casuarinus TaxID=1844966 RepID=A0ABD2PUS4_9PLAT